LLREKAREQKGKSTGKVLSHQQKSRKAQGEKAFSTPGPIGREKGKVVRYLNKRREGKALNRLGEAEGERRGQNGKIDHGVGGGLAGETEKAYDRTAVLERMGGIVKQ